MDKIIKNVKRNKGIVEQYRNLPDVLSVWAQQADQYIIEITNFVEQFINEIT